MDWHRYTHKSAWLLKETHKSLIGSWKLRLLLQNLPYLAAYIGTYLCNTKLGAATLHTCAWHAYPQAKTLPYSFSKILDFRSESCRFSQTISSWQVTLTPPALTIFCHVFSYMHANIYTQSWMIFCLFVCLIKTSASLFPLPIPPPISHKQQKTGKPVTSNSARGCFIYTHLHHKYEETNVKRVSYYNKSRNQFSSNATWD